MKLFLHVAEETPWAQGEWHSRARRWQEAGSWEMTDDPEAADAIVMTLADPARPYGECVERLEQSEIWRGLKEKTFVFDSQDGPLGLFPGIYTSLRRSLFSRSRHRTGCYMQSFNEFVDRQSLVPRPPLLFSFQGNLTAPVRARILALDWKRSDVLLERTEPFWTNIGSEDTKPFKSRYAQTIADSRFVLCPKGNGTSSFRLFETMRSCRVPVIISNAWVPPDGVDWAACSVRVDEKDVAKLVEICLAHDDRWETMANAARSNWERWFSEDGLAELLATSIADIRGARLFPESFYRAGWPARRGLSRARRTLVSAKVAGQRLSRRFR